MKGPFLFVVAAIVASGCAQSPPTPENVAENAAEDTAGKVADHPVAVAETGAADANGDRVCERVRRTGTHRTTIICRSRAEVEQEAVEGKQTFDSLRDSQINAGEYGGAGRQ